MFSKALRVWLLIALFSGLVAQAQNPHGRITGRIIDSAGAVVPGAPVQVLHIETNVVTSTKSNQEGNYELMNLVPGAYRLTVELRGFKRYTRGPFELQVGDVLSMPVRVEIGDVTESVTVSTEAPLVDTASAAVGQVIERRRVLDLPIPSGAITYLMQLAPGVVSTTPPTGSWEPTSRPGQSNMSVAGTSTLNSEYTLDGIPNMEVAGVGVIGFMPPPEAVQEFRVQTAAYDASVGHFTGAQVNMVLKSGTNDFHGVATGSYLGRPLMTKPFFTNKSLYDLSTGPPNQDKVNRLFPNTRTTRFRWSIGGPVIIPKVYHGRNRTFWQFSADFNRNKTPVAGFSTVPTLKQRNGDFSELLAVGSQYQIYDPGTISAAGNGRFSREPLPGNIIPASRLNATSLKLMQYYPLPNATPTIDGRNNWTGSPPNYTDYDAYIGRVDQVIGPNHRIYLSYTQWAQVSQSGRVFPNDSRGLFFNHSFRGWSLDDSLTLRPDLVLNLRYGLTQVRRLKFPPSIGFDLNTLGLPASLVAQLTPADHVSLPQVNIDGYQRLGEISGSTGSEPYHTVAASVMHLRGSHSLRFGTDVRLIHLNLYVYNAVAPSYTFSTNWTRGPLDTSPVAPIGQGLASFLLGLPTGGVVDRDSSIAANWNHLAYFVHDDWKLTRKLTLNIGLRYEVQLTPTERFNRVNRGFDFAATNPVQQAAQAKYALNPIPEVPVNAFRTPGGLLFAAVNGQPRNVANADTNNIMPRIGLAYQLQPRTVVRAGYGIFFDVVGTDIYQQGFAQQTAIEPSLDNGLTFRANINNPLPGGVIQPRGVSTGLATFLGRDVSFGVLDRKAAYSQRWSFNIQRELPHRVMIETGYTGNRATGLAVSRDFNAVPRQYFSQLPVRDQTTINFLAAAVNNPFFGLPEFAGSNLVGSTVPRSQLLKPYPEFTTITGTQSAGFAWYHAFHVRAEKRFSHGYTIQGSYTFSKFMEAVELLNPSDLSPHHVISSQDRPHHFAASGIYELPFGHGKRWLGGAKGVTNHLAAGWSVQAIYQAQSGPPIGFGNVIFNGNIHDIVLTRGERTVERWFNTTAGFETNSARQLASNIVTFPLRFTGLRADGFNVWDISAFKNFRLWENVSFQLRAEANDALNHAMFNPPNTSPVNSLFGQVTGTQANLQRKITVGGRLTW